MGRRQGEGNETWYRLRDWSRGQTPAERLAAHLLRAEGFESIDPSHPLGGKDGLKDVICTRGGKKWIGAAYFPRGEKSFKEIRDKFLDDLRGVEVNKVDGIAFITNQELRLAERAALEKASGDAEVLLLHLERVTSVLNSPAYYGLRLEYLDIEMTVEEQLAFISQRDKLLESLSEDVRRVLRHLEEAPSKGGVESKKYLKAFRFLLADSSSSYRQLVKSVCEHLDKAVPVLIESESFDVFIEKATGATLRVEDLPRDFDSRDQHYLLYSIEIVSAGFSGAPEDLIIYAIPSTERRFLLNDTALQVFRTFHQSLMQAIDDESGATSNEITEGRA